MLFDPSVHREAAAEALSIIMEDASQGSGQALEYALLVGVEDPYSFDPRLLHNWSGFVKWASDTATRRVEEEVERIADECLFVGNDRLEIWREMVVDRGWLDRGIYEAPLGLCWSWSKDYAIAYQGKGHGDPNRHLVRIRATAPVSGVDWMMTLALNAAAGYTSGDEKEIRLLSDCELSVTEIAAAEFGRLYSSSDTMNFGGAMFRVGEAVPQTAAACT